MRRQLSWNDRLSLGKKNTKRKSKTKKGLLGKGAGGEAMREESG